MSLPFNMKVEIFDSLPSTQEYLIDRVREENISENLAIFTEYQTSGVGSRGNSWIGERGNLFLSILIQKDQLPEDIPPQSLSIYFSMLMRDILIEENSALFLKWPNDFYINNQKVGGTVTNMIKNFLIIGVGINTESSSDFGKLEIKKENIDIVKSFIELVENRPGWKTIFERYRDEFEKSRQFSVSSSKGRVSLLNSELQNDGSIILNGERIFSNR